MFDSGALGAMTSVSEVGGSFLGEFDSMEKAENFIKKRMKEHNFYSNVWYQDDHGGISLREL